MTREKLVERLTAAGHINRKEANILLDRKENHFTLNSNSSTTLSGNFNWNSNTTFSDSLEDISYD